MFMKGRAVVLAVLMLALSGCEGLGGFGAGRVAPGDSAAHVDSRMGPPAERLTEANGNVVWFYPGGRLGRETWAVRIGPDGRVREVEQRLTEANIAKIVPNQTTTREVRALLGPPDRDVYYPATKLNSWSYPMVPGPMMDWMVLWVEHEAGVVRKVTYTVDPERNAFSTDGGNTQP